MGSCKMVRLFGWLLVLSLLRSPGAGRVITPDPHQQLVNIDNLLDQANPDDNDIYSEPVLVKNKPTLGPLPQPDAQSPTQHLLETFSAPRYIDDHEVRNYERLPPALDINRQLTLLSASKRILPPSTISPEAADEEEVALSNDFVLPAALFREDLPTTNKSAAATNGEIQSVAQTSNDEAVVSVNTEYNESIDTTEIPENIEVKSTNSTDFQDTITTTEDESKIESPIASKHIVRQEPDVHPTEEEESPRSGRQFPFVFRREYPDYGPYSPLSPLAHILSGFGSEYAAFGGDYATSDLISGYRPYDF